MINYVFISYAWVDDEPLPGAERGWILTLADALENLLAKKLGRKDIVRGWLDKKTLPRNTPITPELLEAVRCSAAMVIVLSQGYLASDWCRQEREAFLNSHPDAKLYIVERDKIERTHKPRELRDYAGYRFWVQDKDSRNPRVLGEPKPDPSDRLYYEKLNDLAQDIADELKRMKSPSDQTSSQIEPTDTGQPPFPDPSDRGIEKEIAEIEKSYERADYQNAYRKFKELCSPYPAYKDQAISFLSRFNDLNNQIIMGNIRNEDQSFEKRQIGSAFLMCLKRFKEEHI